MKDKQCRILDLCLNMLETIAHTTDGMEVGYYDCRKLYMPHFRYEPPFEFTEDDVKTIREFAKANFGYFAGYYSQEVCDIIYKIYQCSHPIFGNKPFEINPKDAYEKGLEVGSKLK